MLLGETVPAQWETVNSVFLVLCEKAGRDPSHVPYAGQFDDETSYADSLEQGWNEAVDDVPPVLRLSRVPYDDEPPF